MIVLEVGSTFFSAHAFTGIHPELHSHLWRLEKESRLAPTPLNTFPCNLSMLLTIYPRSKARHVGCAQHFLS